MSYCSSGCVCPDYYKIIGIDELQYTIYKEIIGSISAILTAITLIPQIIVSIKSKGKDSISYCFLFITFTSCIFWFIYGLLLGSISTILLQVIVVCNSLILFTCKLRYKYNKNKIKFIQDNTNEINSEVNNENINENEMITITSEEMNY